MTAGRGVALGVVSGVLLAAAPSAAQASDAGTSAAPPAATAALTAVAVTSSMLAAGQSLISSYRRGGEPPGAQPPGLLMLQRSTAVAGGIAWPLTAAATGRWSLLVVLLAVAAAVMAAGRSAPILPRLAAAVATAVMLPPAVAVLHTRGGSRVWQAVAAAEPLSAAAVLAAGVGAFVLTTSSRASDHARLRRALYAAAALSAVGAAACTTVLLSDDAARPFIGGPLTALALGVGAPAAAAASVALARRPAVPAAVVLAAVVAVTGLLVNRPAAPRPSAPAGTPVLRHLSALPGAPAVLVAPGRPGVNVVHLLTAGAQVGTRADALAPTTTRPGAGPGWAEVRLGPGHNRIWLLAGGVLTSMDVDAGPIATTGTAAADLPECAATVLGGMLAARPVQSPACPADRLAPADVRALHATVDFLAGRKVRAVALVTDQSPRGVQAAAAARARARLAGVRITKPGSGRTPVLVVSGWPAADVTVRRVATNALPAEGVYLAPWLLVSALLGAPAGQVTGLDFDPGGPVAHAYLTALQATFPGDPACTGGYRSFAGAGTSDTGAPVRLFASSPIVMPGMDGHGGHADTRRWLPGGAVTAVTRPLG